MEGLFFESSLTTPFHFLNAAALAANPSNPVRGLNYHKLDFPRGLTYLALYGVDYYVAWTDEAADLARGEGLEEIASPEPVVIFKLPDVTMVDVAEFQPVVYTGDEPFLDAALNWYDDYRSTDHWMVVEGPEDWPTVEDSEGPFAIGEPLVGSTEGAVSDVVIDDHSISFTTTAIGKPHLVKVSYFPAWSVDGADGPYRAAPSLMIVVPTEENVVLEFKNGVPENVGAVLTVVTILGLGGWWVYNRRRRRRDLIVPMVTE